MRLFPPVSDGSQRIVPIGSGGRILEDRSAPSIETVIDAGAVTDVTDTGSYLPEGTITTVHMYSIHRDGRNFSPLPDSFWPERWIHAAAGDKSVIGMKLVHNASAFFPFSFGPGNCAGKALAMQELRMVVSAMIQRLDLSLDDSFDPVAYENELLDYLILTRPPLPVTVRQRERKQTAL